MKILKKHVEMGEKIFDIAIDRAIAAEVFEAFPEQLEATISLSSADKKSDGIVSLAKEGQLKNIIILQERTKDVTRFSLPMLLEKAGEENSKSIAEEIMKYAEENEVSEFYDAVWNFIMMGFTSGERETRAKVSFVMK